MNSKLLNIFLHRSSGTAVRLYCNDLTFARCDRSFDNDTLCHQSKNRIMSIYTENTHDNRADLIAYIMNRSLCKQIILHAVPNGFSGLLVYNKDNRRFGYLLINNILELCICKFTSRLCSFADPDIIFAKSRFP